MFVFALVLKKIVIFLLLASGYYLLRCYPCDRAAVKPCNTVNHYCGTRLKSLIRAAVVFLVLFSGMGGQGLLSAGEYTGRWGAEYDIAIPPSNTADAINRLAKQTGVPMLFSYEVAQAQQSGSVVGRYTVMQALDLLLQDTGLAGGLSKNGVLVIALSKELAPIDNERHMMNAQKNSTSRKKTLASILGFFSVGLTGGVSMAQDAVEVENGAWMLEEVVVTAQKRADNLQEVPISITAMTEEVLERIGAEGFSDYVGQVPGITYMDRGGSRSRLIVRGIDTTQSDAFQDTQSASAIYIDELPSLNRYAPWTNTDLSMFDIERVEVLRGPQGTLFGSGALGGGMRIITNKPDASAQSGKIEAGVSYTEGGTDNQNYKAMVNVPLIQDELALRAVAYYRDEGGYVDNRVRDEKNVNSSTAVGGRILLGYSPTEALDLRLTYLYQDDEVDDVAKVNADADPDYSYDSFYPSFTDTELSNYNLYLDYDFDSVLLTSSTSYAEREDELAQEVGRLLDLLFSTGPDADYDETGSFETTTFAQEVRFTSQSDGPLRWVVGGFYFQQDKSDVFDISVSTLADQVLYMELETEVEEKALFGEASYQLTEALTLTAGLRVSDNTFEQENPVREGLLGSPASAKQKIDESGSTPKFAIAYQHSSDINLYAQIAKGYRVGQINPNAGLVDPISAEVIPDGYDSDSLWNYELGIKSFWYDQRLKFNAAVFYIDWEDIPLLRFTESSFNYTDNAGDATSEGVELELVALPAEWIEIGSSLTYVEAELESVVSGVPFTPGDQLPGSPRFAAANYIQLTMGSQLLPEDMSGYLRLNHRYQGEQISNLDNAIGQYSDSYNVFDLRAGVAVSDYEFIFHITNLTNNDAFATKASNFFEPDGFGFRLRPRTTGITARMVF